MQAQAKFKLALLCRLRQLSVKLT